MPSTPSIMMALPPASTSCRTVGQASHPSEKSSHWDMFPILQKIQRQWDMFPILQNIQRHWDMFPILQKIQRYWYMPLILQKTHR